MIDDNNCFTISSESTVSKLNDDNTTISLTKGCTLAGQFHLAGSSWHPYLPPNGFDTCALCTCDVSILSTNSTRILDVFFVNFVCSFKLDHDSTSEMSSGAMSSTGL